tara:strand:+ start:565 stop:2775 length:2211 start_codon:yes stop_codon:yes gene_type:complete
MTNKYLPMQPNLLTSPPPMGGLGALSQSEPVTDPLQAPAMSQFSSMYAAPRTATPAPTFLDQLDSDPKKNLYLTLLRGGFNTMAAAGKPGSTGLGAIGEGYGAAITQGLKRKDEITKIAAAKAIAQQKFRQKQQEIEGTAEHRKGLLSQGGKKIDVMRETLEQKKKTDADDISLKRDKLEQTKNKNRIDGQTTMYLKDTDEEGNVFWTPKTVNKYDEKQLSNLESRGYISGDAYGNKLKLMEINQKELDSDRKNQGELEKINIQQQTLKLAQNKNITSGMTTVFKFDETAENGVAVRNVNKASNPKEYAKLVAGNWYPPDAWSNILDSKKLSLQEEIAANTQINEENKIQLLQEENKRKNEVTFYDLSDPDNPKEKTLNRINDAEQIKTLQTEGKFLTGKMYKLLFDDKKANKPKYEIYAGRGASGPTFTLVDTTKEASLKQAINSGHTQKLGAFDMSPNVETYYDTDGGPPVSVEVGSPKHRELMNIISAEPSKYVKVTLTLDKPPKTNQTVQYKLTTKKNVFGGMRKAVDNVMRAVSARPKEEIVGLGGTVRGLVQNIKGSAESLSNLFTTRSSYESVDDEGNVQTNNMTDKVQFEENKYRRDFLDPKRILKKLQKNGLDISLLEVSILQHRMAYIAARMDKPAEKINKSDVEANLKTYDIKGAGRDEALAILSFFQNRLVTEIEGVDRELLEIDQRLTTRPSLSGTKSLPPVPGTPPVGTFNATDGTFTKAKQ